MKDIMLKRNICCVEKIFHCQAEKLLSDILLLVGWGFMAYQPLGTI